MSAKIETQNVTPCTKEIRKPTSSDFSPEDIQKIAAIVAKLKDKALMLKKIHNSLGVGGIKNVFDLENPKLTNEEQKILKVIEVGLKKRGKCFDDINQAFEMNNPKWTVEQMKNVKSIMGLVNCQRYKIEEKLAKINVSKWSSEELKIPQKVSMTFRIQTKLIEELKRHNLQKILNDSRRSKFHKSLLFGIEINNVLEHLTIVYAEFLRLKVNFFNNV